MLLITLIVCLDAAADHHIDFLPLPRAVTEVRFARKLLPLTIGRLKALRELHEFYQQRGDEASLRASRHIAADILWVEREITYLRMGQIPLPRPVFVFPGPGR